MCPRLEEVLKKEGAPHDPDPGSSLCPPQPQMLLGAEASSEETSGTAAAGAAGGEACSSDTSLISRIVYSMGLIVLASRYVSIRQLLNGNPGLDRSSRANLFHGMSSLTTTTTTTTTGPLAFGMFHTLVLNMETRPGWQLWQHIWRKDV